MAEVRVIRGHLTDRGQVIAEIMADGYWPISWKDKPGVLLEAHRHCDDETLYMIEGDMEIVETDTGATHHLVAGDKLILPARLAHASFTQNGATYIMGIKTLVPMDEHIQPY